MKQYYFQENPQKSKYIKRIAYLRKKRNGNEIWRQKKRNNRNNFLKSKAT